MKSLGRSQRWLLLFLDITLFALLLIAFFVFRLGEGPEPLLNSFAFYLFLVLLAMSQYWFSLYDLEWRHGLKNILEKQTGSVLVVFILTILANYLLGKYRSGIFGRGILISTLVTFDILSVFLRYWLGRYNHGRQSGTRYLFLVDDVGSAILKAHFPLPTHWPVEFVRPEQLRARLRDPDEGRRRLWILAPLKQTVTNPVNWEKEVFSELILQRFAGEQVVDVVSFIEENYGKIPLDFVDGGWLLEARGFRLLHSRLYQALKRMVDILCASILMIVIFPVMILVAILIKLDSRGDIFYSQIRAGRMGRSFAIWKFRSMTADAEKQGAQWAQKKDQRITKIGHWLRKTRLDETPQLINILVGQMSFIGPRPERPEFVTSLAEQIPYFHLRTAVAPGLTGWAQVLYPYGASVEDARQKLQYDLYYMKNYSLALDFLILLKTVQVVLRAKGR